MQRIRPLHALMTSRVQTKLLLALGLLIFLTAGKCVWGVFRFWLPRAETRLSQYEKWYDGIHFSGVQQHLPPPGTDFPDGTKFYAAPGPLQAPIIIALYVPGTSEDANGLKARYFTDDDRIDPQSHTQLNWVYEHVTSSMGLSYDFNDVRAFAGEIFDGSEGGKLDEDMAYLWLNPTTGEQFYTAFIDG